MSKNFVELVFILDMSGSMSGLIDDTIGGFNSLINKQKKESGEALVTTVVFNSSAETIHDRISIADVPQLTENEYVPQGNTALLDAVGDTIHHIESIHKYVRQEDVPEKTLVVITTDGMEIASREYRTSDIKTLIENKKSKNGWEFIFLGANIDAAETSESLGISREYSADYCATAMGTCTMYEVMADTVSSFVKNKSISKAWNKKLKK